MRHPDDARLNDYVDDRLDPASSADLETHLAGCDDCRGRIVALRELATRLDALPAGIPPRRDLRPSPPEPARGSVPSRPADALWHGPWLRAAAIVAGLIGAGIGIWLGTGPEGVGPAPTADLIRSPVAASYARAGDELAAALRARRSDLNPAAARALDTSLAAVERAILEIQARSATGDEAVELARHLEARHRTRLELLRGALDQLEDS